MDGTPLKQEDDPYDPMGARVTALEADMRAVRSTLDRIDGKLDHLATKADLATAAGAITTLSATVTGLDRRITTVEVAIKDTIATALSKSLGAGAIVGLVAGIGSVAGVLVLAVAWALKHLNLT